jgi:hypothetical protein
MKIGDLQIDLSAQQGLCLLKRVHALTKSESSTAIVKPVA